MRRVFHCALFIVLASAVAVGAAGVAVLRPRLDQATSANAVVVLSGDHGERLVAGLELMERDVAPTLVLVGAPDFAEADALCRDMQDYEVVCLRPEPDPNTRGQARAVTALANTRAWRSLAIVTSTQHVTRARLLFDRCFQGELAMIGADLPPEANRRRAIAHEWLGLVHAATFARGC